MSCFAGGFRPSQLGQQHSWRSAQRPAPQNRDKWTIESKLKGTFETIKEIVNWMQNLFSINYWKTLQKIGAKLLYLCESSCS
jgi:hypothetical protein